MNLDQQNQLEAYLSGQMPPEEMKTFEAMLNSSPELQQEVRFQSDIIKGIGQYRKAQLKARLDAIQVTPGYWFGLQGSTLGQLATGAVAVLMISAGAYWYFGTESESPAENVAPQKVDQEIVIVPENDQSTEELPVEETPVKENNDESKKTRRSEKPVVTDKTQKSFDPKTNAPTSGDVSDEEDFTPDNLPTPEEGTTVRKANEPIEVEVINGRNAKIKYKYYAGKLYLYGDFTAEPYEILEINSAAGRRIYLYHLNAYYEITPTDKLVGVVEVSDAQLIQELTVLRKEK